MTTKPKKTKTIKTKEVKNAIKIGPEVVLVSGAAGYVGRMVIDQFRLSPDVKEIIAIDTSPVPDFLKKIKKVTWIEADIAGDDWQDVVSLKNPEVAIHTAWDLEKNPDSQGNLIASKKFFQFCFSSPTLKKIIYLSSVLPYGATPENERGRLFAEGEMFRENDYSYAVLRKETEASLALMYSNSNRTKKVFVLRLGIVFGPMGKHLGSLHEPMIKMINSLPYVLDSGVGFGLQYVHEDDLVDLLGVLTFNNVPFKGYEVFNVVSDDVIEVSELSSALGKWILKMPPLFIQLFLVIFGSKYGKEVSQKGAWRYLCFPVLADNRKVSKKLKFDFLYSSKEALAGDSGRYNSLAPKENPQETGEQKDE